MEELGVKLLNIVKVLGIVGLTWYSFFGKKGIVGGSKEGDDAGGSLTNVLLRFGAAAIAIGLGADILSGGQLIPKLVALILSIL